MIGIALSGGTLDGDYDPATWPVGETMEFDGGDGWMYSYRRLGPDADTGIDPMQAAYVGRRKA